TGTVKDFNSHSNAANQQVRLSRRVSLFCFVSLAWVIFLSAQRTVTAPDVKLLLEQARASEQANDYVSAERAYRQALSVAPADPEIFKRLGVLYQTELKFPESIEVFRRALSLSSQHPEVNFFLGASYLGSNQFQNAVE